MALNPFSIEKSDPIFCMENSNIKQVDKIFTFFCSDDYESLI